MKRITLTFLIMVLLTLSGISQTTSDTGKTCLPNYQLRNAIISNEIRKDQDSLIVGYKMKVDVLQRDNARKDSIIKNDSSIIILKDTTIMRLNIEATNNNKIQALDLSYIEDLRKEVVRQRRKTTLIEIIVGALVIYKTLKK